jgi:hypothetical protein
MLEIEYLPTASLLPYARNARTHSDQQIEQLVASMKEFGFTNPCLIDEFGTIIAGHGRVMAAKKIGMEQVPCIRLRGLSETKKRALVITDNKLALNAGWDFAVLTAELRELELVKFDMPVLGFSDIELMSYQENPRPPGDDATADPDKEWGGMPEYEGAIRVHRRVVVSFENEGDVEAFFRLIGQPSYTEKTKSAWFPYKKCRDLESSRWADDNGEP